MNDLFGNPITEATALARPHKPRKTGHAAPPGSGPKDMQCRDCAHIKRTGTRGAFKKCGLMEHAWTHGTGTDIKSGDQACSRFLHHQSQP